MNVHLASSDPHSLTLEKFRRWALSSVRHRLVEEPGEADLVLFAEGPGADVFLGQVLASPLFRRHRERVCVFCENDYTLPLLPGIYAAGDARLQRLFPACSGSYAWALDEERAPLQPLDDHFPLLCSFVGAAQNYPVRDRLLQLPARADFHIEDTGPRKHHIWYHSTEEERRQWHEHYRDVLARSAFVLCPRGVSPGSIRLFETLQAGRVPVLIADDYALPPGPDWEGFSLRVAEADVMRLPELLESRRADAPEMGRLARKAWEGWFAPAVIFDRTVDRCAVLRERWAAGPRPARGGRLGFVLRHYWRHYLRYLRRGEVRVLRSLGELMRGL